MPRRVPGGVLFTFHSAQAAQVAVAGTFNSWVGDAAPLVRTGPGLWETVLAIAPGRHHYKYVIDGRDWIVDPANPWISEDAQNNSSFTVYEDGELFIRQGQVGPATPTALYRSHTAVASPDWLRDGVIYQLCVRAFAGTFDGVRARLDYLHDLGVDILWLMPVHPIGQARRIGGLGDPYAVRDFLAIDPALGSSAALRALIGAAHQRGMRVIMDWTLNRASCDNPLTTQHPDWFTRNAAGEVIYEVPNRDYFAGFDFSSRAARAWLIGAMQTWLSDAGFDGLRFDDSDITPTDFLCEIRAALVARHPAIAFISQSTDELHHVAACDLTYDGGVREAVHRIAHGAPAATMRDYWEASHYSFPRGALRMRWLEEKEQGRACAYFGRALHMAAAAVHLTMDGVPHLLMGQEFNEPRWRDWRSLFDAFALDWDAFDDESFVHYRALIALRRAYRALRDGAIAFVDCDAAGMLAYWRSRDAQRILVVVNLASAASALPPQAQGLQQLHAQGLVQGQLATKGCWIGLAASA